MRKESIMDKAALSALADKIEALDGPCRETDLLIATITRKPQPSDKFFGKRQAKRAPRYTASIDAGITLVPEGCIWNLGGSPKGGFASAGLFGAMIQQGHDQIHAEAQTPAPALCAAALRAQANGGDHE
jgi:hypothetical protein